MIGLLQHILWLLNHRGWNYDYRAARELLEVPWSPTCHHIGHMILAHRITAAKEAARHVIRELRNGYGL